MIEAYDCKLFFSQKGVDIQTQHWVGKQIMPYSLQMYLNLTLLEENNNMLLLRKTSKQKKELNDAHLNNVYMCMCIYARTNSNIWSSCDRHSVAIELLAQRLPLQHPLLPNPSYFCPVQQLWPPAHHRFPWTVPIYSLRFCLSNIAKDWNFWTSAPPNDPPGCSLLSASTQTLSNQCKPLQWICQKNIDKNKVILEIFHPFLETSRQIDCNSDLQSKLTSFCCV